MKLYRGPRTSSEWKKTDEQLLKNWAKDWNPRKVARFDGTIDKNGERHTDLGIEIEASDIVDLFNGLVRHYKVDVKRLEKENADLKKTVHTLEDALGKIVNLISYHRDDAPDIEALVSTIREIADKYRWSNTRGGKPKIAWIRWDLV